MKTKANWKDRPYPMRKVNKTWVLHRFATFIEREYYLRPGSIRFSLANGDSAKVTDTIAVLRDE
jgi:hypothetical protein